MEDEYEVLDEPSDAAIVRALDGNVYEDRPGIQIVEDYFLRELEENNREAGYANEVQVPCADGSIVVMDHDPDIGGRGKDHHGFFPLDTMIWLHDKWLSELELERTKRVMEWENPNNEAEEFVSILLPKSQHIITI